VALVCDVGRHGGGLRRWRSTPIRWARLHHRVTAPSPSARLPSLNSTSRRLSSNSLPPEVLRLPAASRQVTVKLCSPVHVTTDLFTKAYVAVALTYFLRWTPLGELRALPMPPSWFKGAVLVRGGEDNEREQEERGGDAPSLTQILGSTPSGPRLYSTPSFNSCLRRCIHLCSETKTNFNGSTRKAEASFGFMTTSV